MRRVPWKWLMIAATLMMFCLLIHPTAADAHLTGIYKYFLKDINNGTVSSKLIDIEINQTEQRLQTLKPQLDKVREAYQQAADQGMTKVRFYNRYAGNMYAAMFARSNNLIDMLSNVYLIRHVIGDDVSQLRSVAEKYHELQMKQRDLQEFSAVLQAIKSVRASRAAELKGANTQFEKQARLYTIAEDWQNLRTGAFKDYFLWTNKQLGHLKSLASPDGAHRWRISEQALNNRLTSAKAPILNGKYYVRADHIYFLGELKGIRQAKHQVFVVGYYKRLNATQISYRIDSVYIDGFPVDPTDPNVKQDVYEQKFMVIDGKHLDPDCKELQYEQDNGSIILISKH